MNQLSCDGRDDPVDRLVRDMTAEEVASWMVDYHNLPSCSFKTIVGNLREQFRWHRLQGRLDRNATAALIAELWLMRRSPLLLSTPKVDPAYAPDLLAALQRLTFAARTSGGTAGRDPELVAACDHATQVIETCLEGRHG